MTEKEHTKITDIVDRIGNVAIEVRNFNSNSDFYQCYCQLFDIATELYTIVTNSKREVDNDG